MTVTHNPALRRWTPLVLAADVPPDTPVPVRVGERELVVWRGDDGAARVWADRCPHRGMRLSFGFVRANSLTCLYHGWRYGGDGACQAIPAHPDLDPPASLRTETLEAAERAGLVWLAGTGDPPGERRVTGVRSLALPLGVDGARIRLGLDETPLAPVSAEGLPPLRIAVTPRGEADCVAHVLIDGDANASACRTVAIWAQGQLRAIEASMEGTAHAA